MRVLNLSELITVSGGGNSNNQKAIEASCKSDINTAMGLAESSGAALGAAFGSAGGPVGAGLGVRQVVQPVLLLACLALLNTIRIVKP